MNLFTRLRRWVAFREASLEVLKHAAVTKYRDVPASQIRALDALEWWEESRIDGLAAPSRTVAVVLPRESPEGFATLNAPELPEQRAMIEARLRGE